MTDWRGQHEEGAYAGRQAVTELQEVLLLAKEKAQIAAGAVAMATGGHNCRSEAGRNAFELVATLEEFTDEMIRKTEVINSEIDRYINGF